MSSDITPGFSPSFSPKIPPNPLEPSPMQIHRKKKLNSRQSSNKENTEENTLYGAEKTNEKIAPLKSHEKTKITEPLKSMTPNPKAIEPQSKKIQGVFESIDSQRTIRRELNEANQKPVSGSEISSDSLSSALPLPGLVTDTSIVTDSSKKPLEASEQPITKKQSIVLTDIFTDTNGNRVARETAQLINTKDLIVNQFNSKIDYIDKRIDELKTQIKSPNLDDNRIEELNKLVVDLSNERAALQGKRDIYANKKGTWASTNAPRFAFLALGVERAREEYLPVLGDLWMHKVADLSQEEPSIVSTISRSAAITDFTHGRISLQELTDYPFLLKMHNASDQLNSQEIARAKDLIALYDLGESERNENSFVLNSAVKKNLMKLITKLQKRAGQDYGEGIKNEDGTLNISKLETIIKSRSEKLNDQILQDLHVHFQNKPVNNHHVVYGRTGLLDPTKKADKNPSGFINSERTQALDMEAIYEKLDGRSILFDMDDDPSKGPYIDKDNIIHMNKSFYRGETPNEPVTIHAVFLNVSAQNKTANVGIQKAINDRGLARLDMLAKQGIIEQNRLDSLKELLANPKTKSFERSNAAINLISHANNAHGYASVDCFGGKDRTGYALALQTYKILKEITQNLTKKDKPLSLLSEPDKKMYINDSMKRWGLHLVSEQGIGAQIIKYSTGYSTMKLTAFKLTLYHTETLDGLKRRINDYYKGMKAKFGPKVIPDLAGPDQLYANF